VAERGPTQRQTRILEIIHEFTNEYGYPPSVREIGERVGLSSSSTVQAHLKTLERCGLIHRNPTKPRALRAGRRGSRSADLAAGETRPEAEYAVLPIVGKVAAGTPITAAEYREGELVVPALLARKEGSFALRISGDSMIDAAILDGDLIVVAPQRDAANGEIVVAMIDGEATVKRFFREVGRVRLQPENASMAPIFAEDVTIVGRVAAVVRTL